jgi:hypothetical protein
MRTSDAVVVAAVVGGGGATAHLPVAILSLKNY